MSEAALKKTIAVLAKKIDNLNGEIAVLKGEKPVGEIVVSRLPARPGKQMELSFRLRFGERCSVDEIEAIIEHTKNVALKEFGF